MYKRILAVLLVFVMVLSAMTGCGVHKFNPNKLTDAQAYVKAAMDDYEIDKTKEFKKASVLLTEDLKTDLVGTIEIDKWDSSEVKALVVVGLGAATGENAEDVTTAEGAEPADPDAVTQEILFIMDGSKSVIEQYTLSSAVASSSAATESPEDMSEVLAELSKANFKLDGEDPISVKTGIAIKELAIEELVAGNPDISQFVTDTKAAYDKDSSYILSEDYLKAISENSVYDEFATLFFVQMQYENRLAVLESVKNMSAVEQEDALELLESDELLDSYELQAKKALVKAKKYVSNTYESNAAISSYVTELKTLVEKNPEGFLFTEEAAKMGKGVTEFGSYKFAMEDVMEQNIMLAAVEKARATKDIGEREYLIEAAKEKVDSLGDLHMDYEEYGSAVADLEDYKASNADQIKAYESELAAAKKAAGADYKTDINYMKVELKYEELNTQLESLESKVSTKKSDLDKAQKSLDDELAEMEEEEKLRKQEAAEETEINALREFCASALDTEVTEYNAKAGQFGSIHKNYAEWQNENLNYYEPKSSYSSGSSYSGSSYSGSSYSGSSSSGSSYDYDKGYGYTAPYEGESLSDYIKRQDPDLYNSMTDRYNSLTD